MGGRSEGVGGRPNRGHRLLDRFALRLPRYRAARRQSPGAVQAHGPAWLAGALSPGFFNLDTAPNMVYEHQARWIRAIELGAAELLSSKQMLEDIERKNRWQYGHYRHAPRHTIEEEHVPYILELKRSTRDVRRRHSNFPAGEPQVA